MNPFRSLRDYETFIYGLPEQFPKLQQSTFSFSEQISGDTEACAKTRMPNGSPIILDALVIPALVHSLLPQGWTFLIDQKFHRLHRFLALLLICVICIIFDQ